VLKGRQCHRSRRFYDIILGANIDTNSKLMSTDDKIYGNADTIWRNDSNLDFYLCFHGNRSYNHTTSRTGNASHNSQPVWYRCNWPDYIRVYYGLGHRSTIPGVTGQNIPRPEYTRVYYSLGQFILRGIFWPRPIHTPSGHNILRGINWPRSEHTRV